MSGHIRRRGERSWELKFDAGNDPLTGKRRIRYHSFKGTKREAEVKLAKLVAENATGEYIDSSKMTVGEFVDRWQRDWTAHHVSPKTFERYAELLRKCLRARWRRAPAKAPGRRRKRALFGFAAHRPVRSHGRPCSSRAASCARPRE